MVLVIDIILVLAYGSTYLRSIVLADVSTPDVPKYLREGSDRASLVNCNYAHKQICMARMYKDAQ